MSPARLHERQLFRICGLAAVRALFERDPARVERLFFESNMSRQVGRFCQHLARDRKPYRQADTMELTRVAGTVLHGGIVAIARPQPMLHLVPEAPREWALDGKPLLLLDGIGNPHNLGAIVRSAAFFGLERIVLANRPDQALPSDASYRIAEGGFEHLSLYRAPILRALDALREDYRVVGTALGRAAVPAAWSDDRPVALVLGNEENGLDRATLAACGEVLTIPGSGRMQSLNVAAAAAILLYTLTRS
jgi:TrmH RNA methyltransferase